MTTFPSSSPCALALVVIGAFVGLAAPAWTEASSATSTTPLPPALGGVPLAAAELPAPAGLACEGLRALDLPKVRIDHADLVAVGAALVLWRGASPTPSPVAFCRVRAVASPVEGSRIGFEVWLPLAGAWNGKTLQAGNGGFAGNIPLNALLDAVKRGYAASATDGGHLSEDGLDASWALGQPERVVDFGWRAVEQTALAAKRIVAQGLGRAPNRAYFVGCSDGGRDALMAAQRMPLAFDGIVAGAPAHQWVNLMAAGALAQRELKAARVGLTVAKLPALQAASLAACAPGAAYIKEPSNCRFEPAALACIGPETDACLTPAQVGAVRRIYAGRADPVTGQRLHGLAPGAEAESGNWDFWLFGQAHNPIGGKPAEPQERSSINESFFRYIVRGEPAYRLLDTSDESLKADIKAARERWSPSLDAVDADLSAFQAHGGKLLQYHGWADAAIPPRMSIDYQLSVARRLGDSSGFHRLFMVPGMNHCGGGAGPWQVDWLAALERWVEQGEAPEALTARHPKTGETQVLKPEPQPADAKPGPPRGAPPVVLNGRVERLADFPSRFVKPRHVDVWLPEGYDPAKRYAVLYMQDGQALFDARTTWNGQSWSADLAVSKLVKEGRIPETLIVGVWNTGPWRYAEYYPQKVLARVPKALRQEYIESGMQGKPLADAYLRFLVEELKPAIDRRYATRPGPESTFVMGSSMGGLISLYAICEYPKVFGGAAGLSTHWVGLPTAWGLDRVRQASLPLAMLNYLSERLPDPATHKIYIDRGDDALDILYAPSQRLAEEVLRDRGYTTARASSRVFEGLGHRETDWAARLVQPLEFLLGSQ